MNARRPVIRATHVGTVVGESTACDVIIPCRDEAPALPQLLARMPAGLRPIVVDNGSRDATSAVARSLGATVVFEPRAGYGAAVHAGLEAATGELVAVIDGDGSMDPAELVLLVEEVAAGRADLAVGRRRPSARGVWPWHARAGNALVLWWLRRRIGMPLHDIAPMRVARRRELLGLGIEDRRFGYPVELLQRATAAGWCFVEQDITYYPRAAGTKSKVSGSVLGTVRAARDFARVLS
jgi:glycosyltransferase involved in cell wall biosynthesis